MTSPTQSVLTRLRSVTPTREHITYDEALRVAELQAALLADLLNVDSRDLGEQHLAGLPRITVTYEDIPVSGMSHWNGQTWVITLAKSDGPARQRFTLLHEFKHIVDHGHVARLYQGDRDRTSAEQAEAVADYFAGCVLVPKRQLKSVWGSGMQRLSVLADHFGVSMQAVSVRLAQTKLNVERDQVPASARCARPISTFHNRSQRFRIARPSYARRSF